MSKNAWIGLVAAVLAAAVIALGVWLFFLRPGPGPATPGTTSTAAPTPTITPRATTTRTPTASATPTPTPTPSRTSVAPFITTDGYDAATRTLTIGANVPGVVSDDGVCTLTATGPGGTVQGSFTAQSTGSTMDCGQMALSSPSFGTGTWTIAVSYASARAAGATSGYEVYIQ